MAEGPSERWSLFVQWLLEAQDWYRQVVYFSHQPLVTEPPAIELPATSDDQAPIPFPLRLQESGGLRKGGRARVRDEFRVLTKRGRRQPSQSRTLTWARTLQRTLRPGVASRRMSTGPASRIPAAFELGKKLTRDVSPPVDQDEADLVIAAFIEGTQFLLDTDWPETGSSAASSPEGGSTGAAATPPRPTRTPPPPPAQTETSTASASAPPTTTTPPTSTSTTADPVPTAAEVGSSLVDDHGNRLAGTRARFHYVLLRSPQEGARPAICLTNWANFKIWANPQTRKLPCNG